MKIDRTSLLGRWFIHNANYTQICNVDTCSFLRICFITGPLKYLFMGGLMAIPAWWFLIQPVIQFGLMGLLFPLVMIIGVGGILLLVWSILYVSNKATSAELYRGWKEKYCTKVEIV